MSIPQCVQRRCVGRGAQTSVCLSAACRSLALRLSLVCLSSVLSISALTPLWTSVCRLFFVCRCLPVACLASTFRPLVVCRSSGSRLSSMSLMCPSCVMHLFCIFFVCRLSVAYLSFVSQLSVILVGINFLSMFGLSSVRRWFIVRLSSTCTSVSGMCRLFLICL